MMNPILCQSQLVVVVRVWMTYTLMGIAEGAREERGASGDDSAGDHRKCALPADGAMMRARWIALFENEALVVALG
jgi:hypothetical protein